MFLKSLTIRGFKSFAATTTLRLEPGITAVVGPNGSGKSNVVDAIAWVLGEQGAKALRGGAMADVIFAGTPTRPALGRAEVVLTIDNSDGALPIDYTEVSISRLLYRSGDSEYAINGSSCRLLDVQELMSDSGIGRELHVIVGQGQLDAVLAARPEDRRGFIEEAAGVLKHRKRKERALRKLEAMAANLARVGDLTAELRRQLGPLGRQAEVARRAGSIQAALRDARLRLLADDVTTLRDALAHDEADQSRVLARLAATEATAADLRADEARLEGEVIATAPALAAAQDSYVRLAGLRERLGGLASLAAERARHLDTPPPVSVPGQDPEALSARAAALRARETGLASQLAADRARLGAAATARAELERLLLAQEALLVDAARSAARRRDELAGLEAELAARSSRAEAGAEEIERTRAALAEAAARAAAAAEQADRLRAQAGGLDSGEEELARGHEQALAALADAEAELARAREQEQVTARDSAAAHARAEALALSLTRRDGTAAVLASAPPGTVGSVAALLEVTPGWQAALAAALGPVADAVTVESPAAAARALRELRASAGGRAGLLIASPATAAADEPTHPYLPLPADLPAGARAAVDLVRAPGPLEHPVRRALAGVVAVDTLDQARAVVESHPQLRAVTREGDLLGRDWAIGGGSASSLLEIQAALDEAAAQAAGASVRAEQAAVSAQQGQVRSLEAAQAVASALERLHEADARMAALSEQLGLAAAQERGALAEVARLERALESAVAGRDRALAELAQLQARRDAALCAPELLDSLDSEQAHATRDELAVALGDARGVEVEARLTVRSGEERLDALAGQADALERSAAEELARREQAARLSARRRDGARLAGVVAGLAGELLAAAESSRDAALRERDAVSTAATVREGELLDVRARLRETSAAAELLRDAAHRDEVARAEQRLRIEALVARAGEEFGVTQAALLEEYGPGVAVPPEDPDTARPTPYDRVVQERRAAAAERQLAQLGRVNPLALEEFAALEERHAFLATQVEDLTRSRRDLLAIVREVDEKILDVFQAAFLDTAREFETVFATLFPGGEGRLSLTDPGDLLTTGIEVHARPAGKRVSRLSLLSGGERSLAAIALLIAIFRARPSPFYVLDEVEAALDDRNLGRLLDCLDGLRASSQLIVITHQKRTMEIADALYGVSMRADGVSAVISQRLREPATA